MRRLVVLIAAAGCSAGRGTAPSAPNPLSTDRATWQARAAFDSALQTADTARIVRLFAPDACLIAPSGDSIRGREAIALYLARLGHDATTPDQSGDGSVSLAAPCRRGNRNRRPSQGDDDWDALLPARITGLFAPNAYLIDQLGDTVQGNVAIARYVATLGQGSALLGAGFGVIF